MLIALEIIIVVLGARLRSRCARVTRVRTRHTAMQPQNCTYGNIPSLFYNKFNLLCIIWNNIYGAFYYMNEIFLSKINVLL